MVILKFMAALVHSSILPKKNIRNKKIMGKWTKGNALFTCAKIAPNELHNRSFYERRQQQQRRLFRRMATKTKARRVTSR